ncbi:hypothetical protein SUGI_1137290 [Cryptomeria japonica]|nr:hypothetical protein SUGI_1137290 [Cryptomeria japonica]
MALKLVHIRVLLLIFMAIACNAEHSAKVLGYVNIINRDGPYMGLVVPNTFEMEPLLQPPNFIVNENISYIDLSGRRFHVGAIADQKVIVVMARLGMLRQIVMQGYTEDEIETLNKFKGFATGFHKLPREWRCYINYHKFARNVIVKKVEDKKKAALDTNGLSTGTSTSMDKEEKKKERWYNLLKALHVVQDVSMEGIQWFQHFRFHCDDRNLTLPLEYSEHPVPNRGPILSPELEALLK